MKMIDLSAKLLQKKFIRSNDGVAILELEQNKDYSLAYGELLPNEQSKNHFLEMQEIYFFLEGQGELIIETKTISIKKGMLVKIPEKKKQYLKNTGDSPLRFLCIVNPPFDAAKEKILE
jgi:mannose-6-phosphate isomerase-like protein (cupin superfamily)